MCSFVLHTLSYLITIAKVVDRNAREEAVKTPKKPLQKLLKGKKALAVPVTYLILFVSLIAIISVTYSYAVVKINSRGSLLKASVAKQNMQILDDAVSSVAWSFGASKVVYMDDCGGVFQTSPTAKNLILNLTDEQSFYAIVFNSSVGKISYQLEPTEYSYESLFIRGDYRAIINQTAFTMTQLHATVENNAQTLVLYYRPFATSAVIGTSDGKILNLIRVNIINLNFSQTLRLREKFHLKVASLNVSTTTFQYDFNQTVSSLALKATLDGTLSTVWLPISSNAQGAAVTLEIVVCNIQVQKAEV